MPHKRAFTLIEVLAVVFVILILAAIVIPRIVVIRIQSIQQRNNYNGREIAAAVERLQWSGGALTNLHATPHFRLDHRGGLGGHLLCARAVLWKALRQEHGRVLRFRPLGALVARRNLPDLPNKHASPVQAQNKFPTILVHIQHS